LAEHLLAAGVAPGAERLLDAALPVGLGLADRGLLAEFVVDPREPRPRQRDDQDDILQVLLNPVPVHDGPIVSAAGRGRRGTRVQDRPLPLTEPSRSNSTPKTVCRVDCDRAS